MSTMSTKIDALSANEKSICAFSEDFHNNSVVSFVQEFNQKDYFSPSRSLPPSVSIANREVIYNGKTLSLYRKAKLFGIFQLFCQSGNNFLTSHQIIEQLYGINIHPQMSQRNITCLRNNVIKMISRGRILATLALGGPREDGIQWFTHVRELDGWYLFQKHR